MFFNSKEKMFSLARTSTAVPTSVTNLFEELYCYLLVAGIFIEGQSDKSVRMVGLPISDKNFAVAKGSYNSAIATMITKGLKDRYAFLVKADITEHELSVLHLINNLFLDNKGWSASLTGSDLFGIALARNFSAPMSVVARYVAASFGRTAFPSPTNVPWLYLSCFGNIHLSTETSFVLDKPMLPYGTKLKDGTQVTAMWAGLSGMIRSISQTSNPGDTLGDLLLQLSFLSDPEDYTGEVPSPTYAASLYIQRLMGVDGYQRVSAAASFYQSFLYGATNKRSVSRATIINYFLDLMGTYCDSSQYSMFSPTSCYRQLTCNPTSSSSQKRPYNLTLALESLDDDATDDNDDATDTTTSDTDQDTSTVDGGYDPSAPATNSAPVVTNSDMDTIGLLSFDRTGEGVNETLYRQAVVALNDRLKSDEALPVSTETREALDYWVNGFLYLTAISSTKDYLSALNLQRFLKKF